MVYNQARQKPGCTTTENGQRFKKKSNCKLSMSREQVFS